MRPSSEPFDTLPSLCFMVPCLNEEANVARMLETIGRAVEARALRYEILVIDDGSTDQTSAVVTRYIAAHLGRPIRLHRNERNRGLGFSYMLGAELTAADYYLMVCGDNAMPEEALARLLDQFGRADIISPYSQETSRPWTRRAVSRLFTIIVGLCSGHRLRYYNGSVIHRRSTVLRLGSRAHGFGYQAEILCRALAESCTYLEVEVPVLARTQGRSAAFRMANILSVLMSLARILGWRLRGMRTRARRVSPGPAVSVRPQPSPAPVAGVGVPSHV